MLHFQKMLLQKQFQIIKIFKKTKLLIKLIAKLKLKTLNLKTKIKRT